MGHVTQDELAAIVTDSRRHVKVGAMYAHYRHPRDNFYTVLDVALTEATDEPAVVYRAEYGAHIVFVRPLSVWLETVDVEGRPAPRFTEVKQ